MNIKEGDLLYDGTSVFRVTAYIAEPQVTIVNIGATADAVTYPLSQLPKGMIRLVPEIENGRRQPGRGKKVAVSARNRTPLISKIRFRGNSKMHRAYEFMKTQTQPVTVAEILQGIGLEVNASNKSSMASDLYRATNRNKGIVLIPPALFTLAELHRNSEPQKTREQPEAFQLPANFGKDTQS